MGGCPTSAPFASSSEPSARVGWRGSSCRTVCTGAYGSTHCASRSSKMPAGSRSADPPPSSPGTASCPSIPCSRIWTTATSPAARSGTAKHWTVRPSRSTPTGNRDGGSSGTRLPWRIRRSLVRRRARVAHARARRESTAGSRRVEASRRAFGPRRSRHASSREHLRPSTPSDGSRPHRGRLRTGGGGGRRQPRPGVRRTLRSHSRPRAALPAGVRAEDA